MKKLSLCLVFLMAITAGAAMAQDYPSADFNLRLGIQYPHEDIKRVGFDTAIGFNYWINPFFAPGIETGFGWISKSYSTGDKLPAKGVSGGLTRSDDLNIFSLPVLAKLTIGLGTLKETSGILPYISGGAGYSWQFYRFPGQNDTYHGFTWEVLAGVSFDLGEAARGMEVLVEAGYRGTMTENGRDYELNMSGLICHLGVSFPLNLSGSE